VTASNNTFNLMEQVDNPDHSLFRPPWNATKQSYAKQRGKWTMRAQSNATNSEPDTVVPFAPAFENAAADSTDQLDGAGQTILNMLQNAANLAEANSQHALDMAQRLSHQLRAAEARIAELEAEGQRTRTGPNARNNGWTESTAKSRIDF
jgi:hypothetical protein